MQAISNPMGTENLQFLAGGGEMGARIRSHDWSRSIGSPETWPEALKTLIGLMLSSTQPMFMIWGPGRVWFHNDAMTPLMGTKHPAALGQHALDTVWVEARKALAPLFAKVFAGEPVQMDDITLELDRRGQLEEAHFAFSYTPVRGLSGSVDGLFGACTDTTAIVIGERRRGEEIARHRLLLQQMPGFVAVLSGPEHVFQYVNDAYAALSGQRAFVGRTVREAFPELEGQPFLDLLDGVYASGKPFSARAIPVHLTGEDEDRFIDLLYEPIRNASGAITGIFVGGYDVTEAQRTERELRESERRYRALFNAIDEGFCIIEFFDGPHGPLSDYIHVEANPAYAIHAGIPNVVGQTVRAMVGAEAQGWIDLYAGVLRTGEPIRFERELEATGRWLELAAFRIEPASRRQVAVIFQDLTARKRAEIALRASEDNFRTLARVMPNQAWTSAPDGMLDWFNDQVYSYSGAAPGTLDGVGWTGMVHPDDLSGVSARWADALKSGDTYEVEFRLRRADGAYRWHISRAVPIKNDAGRVVRWIGASTDIHDQKEAAVTLEQRVEERTRQLMVAEEALRQSQKMEAVGQLTGGIAHDFNNLLGGISGSLELLEKRLAEGRLDGLQRYIGSAQESSRRAASLTQRLLAFSRRQTLDPKPVDANRLIGGMEELIRRTVGPTIELEVVGADGLWPTRVDPSQLENALLNLCINARDAMAPDGGRLTIETANKWLDDRAARERELPPGQYVSICVTDTGIGMTPEVIARAFDPFFTTKPIGQGTGLGLSMIYGFARQSNGQVRIYSELGKGATMCLYLPRYIGKMETAEDSLPDATADRGAGETVLVIDDEPILRMLITDVLEENGYKSLEAKDGPSGLKILQSDARIDLLITDVGLPGGMNGRQVADAARKVRPDLKVLFVTGYAENAVVGNGHLEPGMEVLTKPFPVATLGHRIRELIER